MLIGITGKAGAGKDTVAGLITGLIPAEVYRFADPLKRMALAIDPIISFDPMPVRLSERVANSSWDFAKQHPEVRRFLQRLGTEGVRGTFGDQAWVDLMYDWWYNRDFENGVIADVRFPNEAFSILNVGGTIIKVIRPDAHDLGANAAHASEQGIDADHEIVNDSDIGALELKVWGLLEELGFSWP